MVNEFIETITALEEANLDESHPDGDLLEEANYMRNTVLPAMDEVRASADKLEKIVADDLWPLPKYSEILFIK
jgi:glutamine synthetase